MAPKTKEQESKGTVVGATSPEALAPWRSRRKKPDVSPVLRKECFARSGGRCVKCGCPKGLHAHHVIAVSDGGTDDIENLDALCSTCHREWHQVMEGRVEYTEWKLWPPAGILISVIGLKPEMREFILGKWAEAKGRFWATVEGADDV